MVLLTEADYANLSLLPQTPQLRRLLESATVVASDAVPPEVVTMNTQGVLQDDSSGERRAVRVERVVYQPEGSLRAHLITRR